MPTNVPRDPSDILGEPYRPRYHFSPERHWMNDPNGLIYHHGEYHLFFQHHPYSSSWGPMHWGHAVSRDLLHWAELPIALYPDDNGNIWSGSIVFDAENTSELVPGGGLIAMFSYDNQSQGLAFSRDDGRTWDKYPANPILAPIEKNFRDPKLFHDEATHEWRCILAAENRVILYGSPDLIHWTPLSEFADPRGYRMGVWECPDLFPLTLNGVTHWVLIISVTDAPARGHRMRYYIGDFDGKTFTLTDPPDRVRWLDAGDDIYAGVTWCDAPDKACLLIGWMSHPLYANVVPTSLFRGSMTLPRRLSLVERGGDRHLAQQPIPQLIGLRRAPASFRSVRLTPGAPLEPDIRDTALDIEATFAAEVDSADSAGSFVFNVRRTPDGSAYTAIGYDAPTRTLYLDRSHAGTADFSDRFASRYEAPLAPIDGQIRLRILIDAMSVEVFGNDGEAVMTTLIFPPADADRLQIAAIGESVAVIALDIYPLAMG